MTTFLSYITGIETLNDTLNEGDGNCIFALDVLGSGLSSDGQGLVTFPVLTSNGEGDQVVYGNINFPLIEIVSQNAIWGDVEFPLIETDGYFTEPIIGNVAFPLLEVTGISRSGNDGEYYFYLQVEGEGNANREYELCN